MAIEICTLGGYTKTEGNSVAIKVDDEVVILDMGLAMENYIKQQEDREDVNAVQHYDDLLKVEALPDYGLIDDWKDMVKAIVPSHGHLDHIGAIPYAAGLFSQAKIISTPYTIEVIKSIYRDERKKSSNSLIAVDLNSTYKVSDKITLEFVSVTHSIPHTAIVVVHTPYGKVMYACDYKFDSQPVIGNKPNFARLEELGKEGIDLLIVECLYADQEGKMPSESVAKQMLKETMLGVNAENKAMIVTTFSSHIARIKSIIEFGKQLDRKIIFLGRSLSKYVSAAEQIKLVNFSQEGKFVKYRDKVNDTLKKIMKEGKDKYLIVCTGHQGEPKAILSRMSRKETPFHFSSGDVVVFSCSVIPVELNKDNRAKLESDLSSHGVQIFRDIHSSGHAAREDHKELLKLVRPRHIIPAHAGADKATKIKELSDELKIGKTHIMKDGERFSF